MYSGRYYIKISLYSEIFTTDLEKFKFVEEWKNISKYSIKKESSSHDDFQCAWNNQKPDGKHSNCVNLDENTNNKCDFKLNLCIDAFGNKMLNSITPHNHLIKPYEAEKNDKKDYLASKLKIDYKIFFKCVKYVVENIVLKNKFNLDVEEVRKNIPEYSAKRNDKIENFIKLLFAEAEGEITNKFFKNNLYLNEDFNLKTSLYSFFYKRAQEKLKLNYFTEDTLHKIREKCKLIMISKIPYIMLEYDG